MRTPQEGLSDAVEREPQALIHDELQPCVSGFQRNDQEYVFGTQLE